MGLTFEEWIQLLEEMSGIKLYYWQKQILRYHFNASKINKNKVY